MRSITAFLLVAGALVLAGCGGGKSSSTTTQSSGPVTITVQIKGGKPVGGIQRTTVKKGDTVALVVDSDIADEVHVHGYDLHKNVTAGGPIRIQFPATLTASSKPSSRTEAFRSPS